MPRRQSDRVAKKEGAASAKASKSIVRKDPKPDVDAAVLPEPHVPNHILHADENSTIGTQCPASPSSLKIVLTIVQGARSSRLP